MRPPIALLCLLGLAALPSSAQQMEATIFGGLLWTDGANLGDVGFARQPVRLNNGFRTGARLSLNSGVLVGHELSYAHERYDLSVGGQKESRAAAHQFYYNFVAHLTPRAAPLRPFFLVGAGYTNFSPGNGGIFADASGTNAPGVNFGGGVKVKVHKFFGLRFDVRDHVTRKPNFLDLPPLSGRLHRMEYSAGASVLF